LLYEQPEEAGEPEKEDEGDEEGMQQILTSH